MSVQAQGERRSRERVVNRPEFLNLLREHSRAGVESGSSIGVMLIKIGHLREINQAYGFDYGDKCLVEIANRLNQAVRPADLVGHLGGGLFGIMVGAPCDAALLELAINRMLTTVHAPIRIDEDTLVVTCRAAGGLYPEHGIRMDRVVSDVECLLHRVFIKGADYEILDNVDESRHIAGFELLRAIETSLDLGQFAMHYQPQIDLSGGHAVGIESLIRWKHPDHGNVSPELYMGLAEKHDVIVPLTRWIFNTALREFSTTSNIPAETKISINLSAILLSNDAIINLIGDSLAIWGVDATRLMVEITETSVMQDQARSLDAMHALRDLGCRISIDDFGTGYSSLAYLERLPVDELKIDKSFILRVTRNAHDQRIVRAVIDLAHTFDMQVVAEGIEDAQTGQLLQEMGCDIGQGYHYSRPVDIHSLDQWFQEKAVQCTTPG